MQPSSGYTGQRHIIFISTPTTTMLSIEITVVKHLLQSIIHYLFFFIFREAAWRFHGEIQLKRHYFA
jgi:hypothetical protein